MPQIAQQDYLKIVGKTPETDANLFAGLVKAIQAGTIFDTILQWVNEVDEIEQARVIGITEATDRVYVYVYNAYNDEIRSLEVNHSVDNYLALAAVQAGGYGYNKLPAMTTNVVSGEKVLAEDFSGGYVTCNGKCVIATVIDDHFAALATSDITPPDGETTYEIAESDLPYFIGLVEA